MAEIMAVYSSNGIIVEIPMKNALVNKGSSHKVEGRLLSGGGILIRGGGSSHKGWRVFS